MALTSTLDELVASIIKPRKEHISPSIEETQDATNNTVLVTSVKLPKVEYEGGQLVTGVKLAKVEYEGGQLVTGS